MKNDVKGVITVIYHMGGGKVEEFATLGESTPKELEQFLNKMFESDDEWIGFEVAWGMKFVRIGSVVSIELTPVDE